MVFAAITPRLCGDPLNVPTSSNTPHLFIIVNTVGPPFPGYPFDVIKTRVQGVRIADAHSPPGVLATARQMAAVDGAGVFYKGFGLKLGRAVPMSMIGFFAYEVAAKQFRTMLAPPA